VSLAVAAIAILVWLIAVRTGADRAVMDSLESELKTRFR
jgi:hypothetical protein